MKYPVTDLLKVKLQTLNNLRKEFEYGRDWTEKKKHLAERSSNITRNLGLPEVTEETLTEFRKSFYEAFEIKLDWERESKKAKNSPQPFIKSFDPTVGHKYHLAWAHKAAIFELREILDDTYGFVSRPKHRRNDWIKVKLSDLLLPRIRV